MKKDKKFLLDLEMALSEIEKEDRDFIVSKYRNIIDSELENKKRIKTIIKDLGPVEVIAVNEKNNLHIKEKSKFKKFIEYITKDLTSKNKESKKSIVKLDKPAKEKKEKTIIKKEIVIKDKKEKKEKKKKHLELGIFFKKISNKVKSLFRKKTKTDKIIDNVKKETKEVIEDIEEYSAEVVESISETHIFENKAQRNKRITLSILSGILTSILIFSWCWITVILLTSVFAYLDGVKIIGLVIASFGLDILWLWIIIMLNRAVYHKKKRVTLNLTVIITCIFLIALGIVLFVRKYNTIQTITDVSDKYSMSSKLETYMLPSDGKKMQFIFNANYDTQYVINYDNKLDGKVKVEVKYYEAYYDYYIKKSSNMVYVSLAPDNRDTFSRYISDLKDGVIYSDQELERYLVKITINEKDKDKIEVID